jgi:hypothetical protein
VRKVLSSAVFCIALSITTAAGTVKQIQDVKSIYVASFGDGDGSELIRSKIISRLVKSGKVTVVETPDHADAILTGVGELSKTTHYNASATPTSANASGGSKYHATAGARLLGRDQRILWADEASTGFFYRSASSSVADKIVKNLLKAMSSSKK